MAAASFSSEQEEGGISDINITPLVDVALVLLIIMMIAAPSLEMMKKLKADIPSSKGAENVIEKKPWKIEVTVNKEIFFRGLPITEKDLENQTKDEIKRKTELNVLLGFDKGMKYEDCVSWMEKIRGWGVLKFSLAVKQGIKEPGKNG